MSEWQETEFGHIPLDWNVVELGKVADVTKLAGFEFTKHIQYVEDGEIIALRALNVREGVLVLDNIKRITKEASDALPRSKLYENDVLFTYVGANIGQFALVPCNNQYHLAPNICRFRPSSKINANYLFNYLRTDFFQQIVTGFSVGSTQPVIPMKNIRKIPIILPPLEEQEDITKTLICLDRKIENLRKQNETLEAIAQTLFKHWFVDFEFPDENGNPYKSSGGAMVRSELGEIPKGWRVGSLKDISVNFDKQRIPLSSTERETRKGIFPYYGAASIMDYIDDYIFDGIYILMGEDGTVIDDKGFPILQYVFGKFWVNNHAHVLQGKKHFLTNFLYLFLKRKRINNIVTGAVQPKINQANMNSIRLVIPCNYILLKLEKILDPIFKKIRLNETHTQHLSQTRDTLLPKLLSGKLRIKA